MSYSKSLVYKVQLASNHKHGTYPYARLKGFDWMCFGNHDTMAVKIIPEQKDCIDVKDHTGRPAIQALQIISEDVATEYRNYDYIPTHTLHTFYGISDEKNKNPEPKDLTDRQFLLTVFINFKKYKKYKVGSTYNQISTLKEKFSSHHFSSDLKITYLRSFDTVDAILLVSFDDFTVIKEVLKTIHDYECTQSIYASIAVHNSLISKSEKLKNSGGCYDVAVSVNSNDLTCLDKLQSEIKSRVKDEPQKKLTVGYENLKLNIHDIAIQDLLRQQKSKCGAEGVKTKILFDLENDKESEDLSAQSDVQTDEREKFDDAVLIDMLQKKLKSWVKKIKKIRDFKPVAGEPLFQPYILDALFEITAVFEQFIRVRSFDDVLFQMLGNIDTLFSIISSYFNEYKKALGQAGNELLKAINDDLLIEYIRSVTILLEQTVNTATEIMQSPSFSTTTFDYPAKLGLFYTAFCNLVASMYWSAQKNYVATDADKFTPFMDTAQSGHPFIIVPTPLNTPRVQRIEIRRDRFVSNGNGLISKIELPGRILYSQTNLMMILAHEVSHDTLTSLKMPDEMVDSLMKAVLVGIFDDLGISGKDEYVEALIEKIKTRNEYRRFMKKFRQSKFEWIKKENLRVLAKNTCSDILYRRRQGKNIFVQVLSSYDANEEHKERRWCQSETGEILHKQYEKACEKKYIRMLDEIITDKYGKPKRLLNAYLEEDDPQRSSLNNRIELTLDLFNECLADMPMVLVLEPTFDQYIQSIRNADYERPRDERQMYLDQAVKQRVLSMMALFRDEWELFQVGNTKTCVACTKCAIEDKSSTDCKACKDFIDQYLSFHTVNGPELYQTEEEYREVIVRYLLEIKEQMKGSLMDANQDFAKLFKSISSAESDEAVLKRISDYNREYIQKVLWELSDGKKRAD